MKGKFITFEGIEGSGKSTHLKHLAQRLTKQYQLEVLVTKEPGGTALGEKIRRLLLDPQNSMAPLTELFLYEASRAEHVHTLILPALRRGTWVLCDRFSDSTIVYQGFARGLSLEQIASLELAATGALVPDCTILLDCPVNVGLSRTRQRSAAALDRMEQEANAFHEKVREGYLTLAAKEPKRFFIIDATAETALVSQQIVSGLADKLGLGK